MDSDDITEFVQDMGAEYNVLNLQTQQFRDEMRQADIVQIYKRMNDEKIGAEVAITHEMLQEGYVDLMARQIEQAIRGIKETTISEMGTTFEYRGREIACGVNAEIARAQCQQCGYEVELGVLPHVVDERPGTFQTFNTVEDWRQERLAIYMLEKMEQECPCGRRRTYGNQKT